MSIDITTKGSPGWWLKKCSDKLAERRKRIDPLYDRYEGKAQMPPELRSAPEPAQRFFRTSRTNFEEMIVRAVRYRMKVTGILTSTTSDEADAEAFRRWRTSGMQTEQHDIHRNLLVAGDGYALCAKHEGVVAATSEDPRQVVTIHDPVRQSVVRASAKLFHDPDEGKNFAYLYRDGRRWVAVKERKAAAAVRFSAGWDWSDDHGGAAGEEIPVAQPVVRYRNEEGVGEFERHLDILDRINHLVLQGIVIATLQAFKQRAIKADDDDLPEEDPETGQKIDYNEVFLADPGALWQLPASAEMWESGAVDLTPITMMATKEIERLSAVTFTPLSMFTPEAANQSATGASLVKEGLTTKVEDKQARSGESHAAVLRLLWEIDGGTEVPDDLRVRWAPAERYSLSEKADAGPKAKAAGMPWRTLMREVWQMEPEDIARMESERLDDALLLSTMEPEAPAAVPSADTDTAAPSLQADGSSAQDAKLRADTLGALVRAGVDPTQAADRTGYSGVRFTREPVAVRDPKEEQ